MVIDGDTFLVHDCTGNLRDADVAGYARRGPEGPRCWSSVPAAHGAALKLTWTVM
jgi:hypothetical protein